MTFTQPDVTYLSTAAIGSLIGSAFDLKSRRIPNLLTGPALLMGLSMHTAFGGWMQMLNALAAGLICGGVFLVFYLAGGMGAGDVKLMAAVGCIGGLQHVPYLLVLTAISGGVMALCLALLRGQLRQTLTNVMELTSHHRHQGLQPHPDLNLANTHTLRLPYALAIAGGSLLTLYFQVTQGV